MAEKKFDEARMAELLDKEAKLAKIQDRERRYAIRQKLMVKKALTAGISVSEVEIDQEIARMRK